MLLVRRLAEDRPKHPKAPQLTTHFRHNWEERTGYGLRVFWKRWGSAQFLGETEQKSWEYGHTGRVRYYAIEPERWVVLVVAPRSGQYRLLSVWEWAWYAHRWRVACCNSGLIPGSEPAQEDSEREPSTDFATAEADGTWASVEA